MLTFLPSSERYLLHLFEVRFMFVLVMVALRLDLRSPVQLHS